MMALHPSERYQNGQRLKEAIDHIAELDDTYKRYRATRRRNMMVSLGLLAASAILMLGGRVVMERERNNAYFEALQTAETALEQGDYSGADQSIAYAKTLIPSRIEAYETEVRRLYEAGEYRTCVDQATQYINHPMYAVTALRDQYSLANMFYFLGNSYYELDDIENAAASFRQALSYREDNGSFYRDLAIALAKGGNAKEAEAVLRKAGEKGLWDDSILLAEGEIAYAKGDYAGAVSSFHRVLDVTADGTVERRAILLCADAYRQMDSNYASDRIDFLRAHKDYPGNTGAYLTEVLAEIYAKTGDRVNAITEFRNLVNKGFGTYQIYENIAILQQENGELDAAEQTLKMMEDLYPGRYETYKRFAFLEAEAQSRKPNAQRDYHRMKEYADKAAELCQSEDVEMNRLEKLMKDLRAGGWL